MHIQYSESSHIYKNLRIFRTPTYLKTNTYSESYQRFKMAYLQKQLKTIIIFQSTPSQIFDQVLNKYSLSILNKYSLTCRVALLSFFSHLLLALLIMSIGKVLFSWVLYYFVFFSFSIIYMLCFVKLCKSFAENNKFITLPIIINSDIFRHIHILFRHI